MSLKGSQYWKFDPSRTPHVRTDTYPRTVSMWDLPASIDGALQWDNRRTYFFKQVGRQILDKKPASLSVKYSQHDLHCSVVVA